MAKIIGRILQCMHQMRATRIYLVSTVHEKEINVTDNNNKLPETAITTDICVNKHLCELIKRSMQLYFKQVKIHFYHPQFWDVNGGDMGQG